MKVRLIFESGGARMEVTAENDTEDKMLTAAFGEYELRGKVDFSRDYLGAVNHLNRRAVLHIKLMA